MAQLSLDSKTLGVAIYGMWLTAVIHYGEHVWFFFGFKKYISIYIYIHIFLLNLYIGWWNFPSHGLRNWGNLSFYSFPSALSDGHLMTMSCLGTTNWFGLAGCPADTSAWRTLPDGGLEVSGINQGFAGVWFPITPWFMLCGIFPWLGEHTLRTHSDTVMYVCNSSYVWIRFFLFLNDLHDEYINLYIYMWFISLYTYICALYVLQGAVTHIYIYIYK